MDQQFDETRKKQQEQEQRQEVERLNDFNSFEFHFQEVIEPIQVNLNEDHSSSSAIANIPSIYTPSPTNVFIANFPKNWNEQDLASIFDGIPILTVHVIRDKIGVRPGIGISRGVGFVNVLYRHEAVALVEHLDRKIWLETEAPLKIRLAKAMAPNLKIDQQLERFGNRFDPSYSRKPLMIGRINLLQELQFARLIKLNQKELLLLEDDASFFDSSSINEESLSFPTNVDYLSCFQKTIYGLQDQEETRRRRGREDGEEEGRRRIMGKMNYSRFSIHDKFNYLQYTNHEDERIWFEEQTPSLPQDLLRVNTIKNSGSARLFGFIGGPGLENSSGKLIRPRRKT